MIIKGLGGQSLPIYGDGLNVRDWIYVEDHARSLTHVLEHASVGATYNIGSRNQRTNISVVKSICRLLDEAQPTNRGRHEELIAYVADRPGHDKRYGIDPTKIERELGWKSNYDFDMGLAKTVKWYVENQVWWQKILDHGYEPRRLGFSHGQL